MFQEASAWELRLGKVASIVFTGLFSFLVISNLDDFAEDDVLLRACEEKLLALYLRNVGFRDILPSLGPLVVSADSLSATGTSSPHEFLHPLSSSELTVVRFIDFLKRSPSLRSSSFSDCVRLHAKRCSLILFHVTV